MSSAIPGKNQTLSMVPFGPIRRELLKYLQTGLSHMFHFFIKILREEPVPQFAFDPNRNQYSSAKILQSLKRMKKNDERILAITDIDLYVPELNFIFGEADVGDAVCIISLVRLRQEYYGLPKNEKLFLDRTLKEAVHEIGHTYRLGHCEDQKCIMHFSNSIQDTDIKGPHFCHRCVAKINLQQ